MSDSDWAVKHSTSGYIFTNNQAAVSWSRKRQTSVALSSCEAEIMALSEASKEGVFLSRFLDELGLPRVSEHTRFGHRQHRCSRSGVQPRTSRACQAHRASPLLYSRASGRSSAGCTIRIHCGKYGRFLYQTSGCCSFLCHAQKNHECAAALICVIASLLHIRHEGVS